MTTEQMKLAKEGHDYWTQYVKINGYAFDPNNKGLEKLSRNLDLNVPHIRRCIHAYLSA